MASVYDLKPKFQALLRPLISRLAAWGCTPNIVTGVALIISIGVGLLLYFFREHRHVLFMLPVWMFIRMALNAIDGMMARELNMKTTLGAVLNEAGDIISDLALYLPLAAIHPPSLWPVIAFSFGAVMSEFCGVLTQALGTKRHYEGPMGKSDRAFIIGAIGLVSAITPKLFPYWPMIFWIAAALTLFTCFNRLAHGLKELRK